MKAIGITLFCVGLVIFGHRHSRRGKRGREERGDKFFHFVFVVKRWHFPWRASRSARGRVRRCATSNRV